VFTHPSLVFSYFLHVQRFSTASHARQMCCLLHYCTEVGVAARCQWHWGRKWE